MEFQIRSHKCIHKKKSHDLKLNKEELSLIFRNSFLHDISSFFIMEPDGTYQDDSKFKGLVPENIKLLEEALNSKHTVIARDMENWNAEIQRKSRHLGYGVNAHLYISPPNSTTLNWHGDDRDVEICLLSGEKDFIIKNKDGSMSTYKLKSGDSLFIPYGVLHKAVTSDQGSNHISFGIWPQGLTIKEEYSAYNMNINLENISK